MGAYYCGRGGVPGGWCIFPDAYSTSTSYVAVVSACHVRPTLSCTTVSRNSVVSESRSTVLSSPSFAPSGAAPGVSHLSRAAACFFGHRPLPPVRHPNANRQLAKLPLMFEEAFSHEMT
eukprot:5287302-Prymnesium_polylepis.1